MHHFVKEMCTFLLQNGALWDMGLVHYWMCATGLLLSHTMNSDFDKLKRLQLHRLYHVRG